MTSKMAFDDAGISRRTVIALSSVMTTLYPAGQEPPGWEWLWELKAQGPDTTEVTLTYDWSKVDDEFRQKVAFPLVPASALEESLGLLASAVS